MPPFPNLGDADIATIQAFLTGLCPATSVTGAELYAGNCASCHGSDATGTPTAPSVRCATLVSDAVRRGRGTAMPAFATITDPESGRLQAYLDGLCTQAGRPGADLYAGNCASCHGADARGGRNALGQDGPDVRCNREIREPVRNGEDGMPAYPGLSDGDISRIQQYLAASACPANAPGADLYAGNCVSCHGADARGVRGLASIRCNRGIHDPVRAGVVGTLGTMPAFTAMPDAEIGRIQSYLLGLCPPGAASGADLYAGNCATCHAADAGGAGESPSVRCSTLLADALARGRGTRMPSFPALTGVDLTAVDGFLAGLCATAGRTGADLYAGNCASCHGASAQGGRNGLGERGPEIQCTGASDYRESVRNGEDSMPAFPGLSDPDVTAIVSFVHGAFCLGR
jgi:mono/diheme cytochrome c family protein